MLIIKKGNVIWLLLIALCSIFVGCKKDIQPKITSVSGKITNKITLAAVSGIPIKIYQCDAGFYIGSDRCGDFMTIYSDNEGNYEKTFETGKSKFYKIAIGQNETLVGPEYAYSPKLISNQKNKIDFNLNPLKNLKIKIKVLRHDKNWIQADLNASDFGIFSGQSFYNGMNPTSDFDITYIKKIEAGRNYNARVVLRNKIAEYTYQDDEFFYKSFYVDNVDTTFVDFTVQ